MRVYGGSTNTSRKKAINDIHHKTQDGGYHNRLATAKSERKAARRIQKELVYNELI